MKIKKLFSIIFILGLVFSFSCAPNIQSTNTDFSTHFLTAYYDLRNRDSYIQITNTSSLNIEIHVQIFQQDRNCGELDFFDQLTPNDTVVYDMSKMIKNDGTPLPINLQDDSYGYVVVSTSGGIFDFQAPGSKTALETFFTSLIGNFRIIDEAGYEYRTNMASHGLYPILDNLDESPGPDDDDDDFPQIPALPRFANFNTIDGAILADVVGYSYIANFGFQFEESPESEPAEIFFSDTVTNFDPGIDFNIFVFDMNEEPLSCDRRNFACGKVMNYGINEDYLNSKGGPLLCPGGGLANPDGGFVTFEDGIFPTYDITFTNINFIEGGEDSEGLFSINYFLPYFVGLIGINNGNGTGSMDYWYSNFAGVSQEEFEEYFFRLGFTAFNNFIEEQN